MTWSKVLLIFQAVVTLLLGVAFFFQLAHVGFSSFSEIKGTLVSQNVSTGNPLTPKNIRNRFTIAAYFLLNIGLIELIIIFRLIN